MNIISVNGFAFRIPELPARYRANCSKEYGVFLTGDTKKMTASQAEKAGLTKGNFVEMALCWVDSKILTFEPNYVNEPFTEIWGIPVAGEMKTQFAEKASELSTFLIHRQSKDRMSGLIEVFSRDAFNQWVTEGMQGDANEYAIAKAAECYFTNIFRFEMTQAEGSYGTYFYVQTSYRKPNGEFELAALQAARQIYDGQITGLGYCTDKRLVENHQASLGSLAAPETETQTQLSAGKNSKMLKAKA